MSGRKQAAVRKSARRPVARDGAAERGGAAEMCRRARGGLLLGAGPTHRFTALKRGNRRPLVASSSSSGEPCGICVRRPSAQRLGRASRCLASARHSEISSSSCRPASTARVRELQRSADVRRRRGFCGYRGIAQDVSDRMRAERLQQLEHTIARILAETDGVPEALKVVIHSICELQGWSAGASGVDDARTTALLRRLGRTRRSSVRPVSPRAASR